MPGGPIIPFSRRPVRNGDVIPLLGGVPETPGGRHLVFAAYPYSFDPTYRAMLRRVEEAAAIWFGFPEDDTSPAHLDSKVLTLLHRASFAVFDWSGWNPNVAFEFGMAMGMVDSRPAYPPNMGTNPRRGRLWIVVKTGTDTEVPSDLAGMGRTRYVDLPELESCLKAELSRHFPLRRR